MIVRAWRVRREVARHPHTEAFDCLCGSVRTIARAAACRTRSMP